MCNKAWIFIGTLLLNVCVVQTSAQSVQSDSYEIFIENALNYGKNNAYSQAENQLRKALNLPHLSDAQLSYAYLLLCHVFMHTEEQDSLRKYVHTLIPLSLNPEVLNSTRGIQAIRDAGTFLARLNSDVDILSLYNKAAQVLDKVENDSISLLKSELLSGRYLVLGGASQWKDAYKIIKEALQHKIAYYGENTVELADTYYDMAYIADKLNIDGEALTYYKKSIDLYKAMKPIPYKSIGLAENNLAYLLKSLKLYKLSLEHFNYAYYYWVIQARDSSRMNALYTNMGNILHSIGRFDEAEAYFKEVLKLLKRKKPPYWESANVYVSLARNARNIDEKLAYYQDAQDAVNRLAGNYAIEGILYNDLAQFYFDKLPDNFLSDLNASDLENLHASNTYFRRELSIDKGNKTLEKFYLLRNQLFLPDRRASSIRKMKELLPEFKQLPHHRDVQLVYYTLGKFYENSAKPDSAWIYYNRLLSTISSIKIGENEIARIEAIESLPLNFQILRIFSYYLHFLYDMEVEGLLSDRQREDARAFAEAAQKNAERYLRFTQTQVSKEWEIFKETSDIYLKFLEAIQEDNEDIDFKILEAIHRFHSVSLLKTLFNNSVDWGKNTGIRDTIKSLRMVKAQLYSIRRKMEEVSDKDRIEQLHVEEMRLMKRSQRLQNYLFRQERDIIALSNELSSSATSFKNTLKEKKIQVLIPYTTKDGISFIISASEGGIHVNIVSIDPDSMIHAFRIALHDREFILNSPHQAEAQYNSYGTETYETFFKSVVDKLDPDLPIAYISYGKWQNLPVHLLLYENPENSDWKDKPYLFKKYRIYYAYEVDDLLQSEEYEVPDKINYAVFGWNNHNSARGDLLNYIKNELQFIRQYADAHLYWGDSSTVEIFLEKAPKYNVVHIATHGIVVDTSSVDSYLSFYPDSIYEGKLTIGQIYNSYFPIDLLVLSACNSGVQNLGALPGYSSFNRAFKHSGVQSTIVSLWNISDPATEAFMKVFYRNLDETHDSFRALYESYEEILRKDALLKLHPYYWGGFIYYGSPKTRQESFIGNYYLILLGSLCLVIAFIWFYKVRQAKK